jgi:hypothetical protein
MAQVDGRVARCYASPMAVQQRSAPQLLASETIDDLERFHADLLASYLAALDDASTARRYIARKLVESHVKRRLEVLASVFAQHALLGDERERHERLAKDARAFADTLSSWRLTTGLALFPILLALAGPIGGAFAGLSFDGWRLEDAGDVVTLVIYGLGLAVYLGGLLPRAFRRKRACLFPDEADPEGRNAYRCEEAVFSALGRARPLERPLDYLLYALVTGLLLLFAPIVGLVAALPFVADVQDVPVAVMLAGYIPGVIAALWLRRRWQDRRWR